MPPDRAEPACVTEVGVPPYSSLVHERSTLVMQAIAARATAVASYRAVERPAGSLSLLRIHMRLH